MDTDDKPGVTPPAGNRTARQDHVARQALRDGDDNGRGSGNDSGLRDSDRRRVLKAGGAGLLGGAALLGGLTAMGEPLQAQEVTELVFAFGPDDSGSLASLIDAFNGEHEGRIKVSWREMARSSDDYYRQIASDFGVGDVGIDVFGADIVWTAQFAADDWVTDLSGRFADAYDSADFLTVPLRSARYRDRLWGVPGSPMPACCSIDVTCWNRAVSTSRRRRGKNWSRWRTQCVTRPTSSTVSSFRVRRTRAV